MPNKQVKPSEVQGLQNSADVADPLEHNAGSDHKQEHIKQLGQLLDNIVNRQEHIKANHQNEIHQLSESHQRNRDMLTNSQSAQQSENLEQQATERQALVEVLERFEANQQSHLQERQALEVRLLSEQAEAAHKLLARQQEELDSFQREPINATQSLDETRDQNLHELKTRAQQEQVAILFDAQNQVLKDYGNRLANCIEQDEEQLQRTFFEQNKENERSETLNNLLTEQEKRQGLLKESYDKAFQLLTQEQDKKNVQYGDLDVYSKQRRNPAIRDEVDNRRKSENEHITAWINLVLSTTNPETGNSFLRRSAEDKKPYFDMVVLAIARDMALVKTPMDLQVRNTLREAQLQDEITDEMKDALRETLRMEADVQRTIIAREKMIEERFAQSKTFEDLLLSTNEKILQAATLQWSVVGALGNQDASEFKRTLSEQEIDDALNAQPT